MEPQGKAPSEAPSPDGAGAHAPRAPHGEPEARSARAGRSGRRARVGWGVVALAVLGGLAGALLVSPGGPALVSVVSPEAGEVVGLEGVQVMVRLPDDGRVDPQSLRVLLNGADVTHQLIRGQNGAVGRLHALLDGENVLRVQVEAASWWFDGRRFETAREVRFLARRPLDLDRG